MIDTLILDRGHATLDAKGKYATPGKQHKFEDGLHVYEGYENQRYVEAIAKYAKQEGFKIEYTVDPKDPTDVSLIKRVNIANASKNKKTAIYISVHNNASGTGKGVGTEIFTSIGKTLSDGYAEAILKKFKDILPNRKLRIDTTDGDLDKEENFYVLKNTSMPAILLEIGFFDNREDYEWLSNQSNINVVAQVIVKGIKEENKRLYETK